MASRLNPYLTFDGNARQAMEFYQQVFGGNLKINTFGEYGTPADQGGDGVMHAMLETDNGFTLMASDTMPGMDRKAGDNITISLSGDDDALLRERFQKLAEGGSVDVPLEKQMWGDEFGQLTDKYGVGWLVNISQPQA